MRFDDGDPAAPALVLAHGAGAPADSDWMNTVTRLLVERGLRVVRFEFPYMAQRRTSGMRRAPDREPVLMATWREVIEHVGTAAFIGEKSMGGRIATMVAAEQPVAGVVCFGYPFHPPGRPERLRTAHLAALQAPALIVQGTRDPFGSREEVASYALPSTIRIHWMEDGDHDLRPRGGSGRSHGEALREACDAAAAFVLAQR